MRLPNAQHTLIERAKLREYILSPEHPVGRFKARFFARLGFTREHWDQLDRALRDQHLTQDAEPGGTDAYGQTFTIRAILQGPTGVSAPIVSVWLIRTGETRPRLITAYPGGLT